MLDRVYLARYRELLEGVAKEPASPASDGSGEPDERSADASWGHWVGVTSGGASGGLHSTLGGLGAEKASRPAAAGAATAVAHARHLHWAIAVVNGYFRGEEPDPDGWEDGWRLSSLDEAAWQDLRLALRREGDLLLTNVENGVPWTHEFVVQGMLTSLAHTAYHLGAFRQMAKAAGSGSHP